MIGLKYLNYCFYPKLYGDYNLLYKRRNRLPIKYLKKLLNIFQNHLKRNFVQIMISSK